MKNISAKLNNQRGASLILALVAFLVAAVIVTVIITAATSTTKRVHDDRDIQQTHLTLSSAAQLVRDEMATAEYGEVKTTKIPDSGTQTVETTRTATGILKEEIVGIIKDMDVQAGDVYKENVFKIKVEGIEMDTVDVSIAMKSNGTSKYKLTFTFTKEGSEEALFLNMDPSVTTNETSSTGSSERIVTNTTTIKWKNPIISGMGA